MMSSTVCELQFQHASNSTDCAAACTSLVWVFIIMQASANRRLGYAAYRMLAPTKDEALWPRLLGSILLAGFLCTFFDLKVEQKLVTCLNFAPPCGD